MRQILIIAKYITAIGVIGGAALWLDAKFDNSADRNESVMEVVLDSIAALSQEVQYINIEQSFQSEDIAGLHDTLKKMNDGIQQNAQTAEQLIWMERNRDEFTPDQMEKLLDEFLKKNISSTLPDSAQREQEWTRQWNDFINFALITEPVTLKGSRNPLTQ